MNLRVLCANMTELEMGQTKILFSYNIPVAMQVLTPEGMEDHVTNKFHSKTTSKHINSWLPRGGRIEHDQEFFDSLVKGA